MSARAACVSLVVACAAIAFSQTDSDRIRNEIKVPVQGATTWTLVFTTGHLGTDPRLSRAIKEGAIDLMATIGSPIDKGRVVFAEMTIWNTSSTFPLDRLPSHLPNAPAPESMGGSDLERVAKDISTSSQGPIVIFSSGESQVPRGSQSPKLLGGAGEIAGFTGPHRFRYDLTPYGESRPMLVTVYLHANGFRGAEARTALQYPTSDSQEPDFSEAPNVHEAKGHPGPTTSLPWYFLLGGAVASSGIGFGLARLSAKQRHPDSSESSSDLETWKSQATRLRKQLDLIAQDLHEAASEYKLEEEAEKVSLRQELARRDLSLETWDEVAIDFIDGLDRVLHHHGPNSTEGKSAQRIAGQFFRHVQRVGLDTINPDPGDEYVPGLHTIEETAVASNEQEVGTISRVIRPGFRRGEVVIRHAKIVLLERNI